MPSNSKVSIILPVYNAELYLHSAIDSILAQTHTNLEVVISDNCSTDKTFEIAKHYADKDERVRLSKNDTNIGWALNLNKTIQDSTGEYIELFGHDDYFEPTCIEKLSSILDQNPNVVVATSARNWIDAKGDLIQVVRKFTESKLLPGADAIRSTIGTMENWISAPAMFRSKFKNHGFNINIAMYADLDYWCQMFEHGDLYYIDEVLFNYRIHDESGTSSMMKDAIFALDLLRMSDRYSASFLKPGEGEAELRQRIGLKLIDWVDFVVCQRKYNIDHLLGPTPVSLSEWPLNPSNKATGEAHDYRRAVCLGLIEAVNQRRQFLEERASWQTESDRLVLEERARHSSEIERLTNELNSIRSSTSWKLTAALRRTISLVHPNS